MDDVEKMQRARVLDLARRQAEAERARHRREGVAPNPPNVADRCDPRNPQRPEANDNQ